jgi:hypothetical protein
MSLSNSGGTSIHALSGEPFHSDTLDSDWTTHLSDPVLAARYRGADIRVGDYSKSAHPAANRSGGTEAAAHVDGNVDGEDVSRLAYSLVNVGGGLPVSRAQVLDAEVGKRVAKAREELARRIEAAKKRVEECKVEREKVGVYVCVCIYVCVCVCVCGCVRTRRARSLHAGLRQPRSVLKSARWRETRWVYVCMSVYMCVFFWGGVM